VLITSSHGSSTRPTSLRYTCFDFFSSVRGEWVTDKNMFRSEQHLFLCLDNLNRNTIMIFIIGSINNSTRDERTLARVSHVI